MLHTLSLKFLHHCIYFIFYVWRTRKYIRKISCFPAYVYYKNVYEVWECTKPYICEWKKCLIISITRKFILFLSEHSDLYLIEFHAKFNTIERKFKFIYEYFKHLFPMTIIHLLRYSPDISNEYHSTFLYFSKYTFKTFDSCSIFTKL